MNIGRISNWMLCAVVIGFCLTPFESSAQSTDTGGYKPPAPNGDAGDGAEGVVEGPIESLMCGSGQILAWVSAGVSSFLEGGNADGDTVRLQELSLLPSESDASNNCRRAK